MMMIVKNNKIRFFYNAAKHCWCNQGDHLSGKPGKPGNVREFETCQGNVRGKSCQGKVSQNCSLLVEYLCSTPFFFCSLCSQTCTPILLNLRCQ